MSYSKDDNPNIKIIMIIKDGVFLKRSSNLNLNLVKYIIKIDKNIDR